MSKIPMPKPVGYLEHGNNGMYLAYSKSSDLPQTPLITTTQAEAYADARVKEALEKAADIAKQISDTYVHEHYDYEVWNADETEDAIRALIPTEPKP